MRLEYKWFLVILSVLILQSCGFDSPQEDKGDYYAYDMGVYINGVEYHGPLSVPHTSLSSYGVVVDTVLYKRDYNTDMFFLKFSLKKLISLQGSKACRLAIDYCDSLNRLYGDVVFSEANVEPLSTSLEADWRYGRIKDVPKVQGLIYLNENEYAVCSGSMSMEEVFQVSDSPYYTCKVIRFDFRAISEEGEELELTDGYFKNLKWMRYWYPGL